MFTLDLKEQLNPEKNLIANAAINLIREEAKVNRWTGTAGLKAFVKEEYDATLRTGVYGDWTSVTFKSEHSYNRFISKINMNDLFNT